MEEKRKGGLVMELPGGSFCGGENASFECSVSNSSMCESDEVCNHAGGAIFARFCFLSRRASQRGMLARCGGCRTVVVPYIYQLLHRRNIMVNRR